MTSPAAASQSKTEFCTELLERLSSLVCLLRGSQVIFMNRAGLTMLGLAEIGQILDQPLDQWMPDEYRILVEEGWDLLADEDFLPLRLIHTDGTLFDAEMRVRRTPYENLLLVEVRDISKYVKSAEALRERENRLQGILSSVAEGIVTINDSGRVESANPAAETMFGYKRGTMLGMDMSDLMPSSQRHAHQQYFDAYVSGLLTRMMGRMVEGQGLRADGSTFPMEISVSELRQGRNRLFTCILRDISERKENEERIRRLAHHDHLTGLPNRNLLNDRMDHALARVRRNGGRMAILYVDLDKFKPINDTLGHEAGDVVLKEVAYRLNHCIRSSDTVARVGGDEFVVVVEEIISSNEAAVVAQKILDRLSQPIVYRETLCTIGASIGGAIYPDDGETLEEVCKAADVAMYRVKHAGRNAFRFFASE